MFSQYRFLDPQIFGSSFFAFRNRYFDMGGYGQHTPIFRKQMTDEFLRRLHSVAFRVTKAECLDLPAITEEVRTVDLEKKAATLYTVSPDTVQKWEVEKNTPPTAEIKRLCELFDVSADLLLDNAVDVADYIEIDRVPGVFCSGHVEGEHVIYDAALRKEAKLHRFDNPAGCPYSAIYVCGKEIYSCERAREPQMLNYWNETE